MKAQPEWVQKAAERSALPRGAAFPGGDVSIPAGILPAERSTVIA
jgi:hypothetical protein